MITVGIDEVGRGCWAGPLVAAAVILPATYSFEDGPVKLRDSKKLSKKQRAVAALWIEANALAIGYGWVWPDAIDSGGITAAVKSAMTEAVQAIKIDYDEVIIDGHINYLADKPNTIALIKADDIILSASAASIVAKVARDKYMADIADHYPGYGFENHVGYGTSAHIAALQQLGITPIHRRSYKPIARLLV